MYGFTQFAAILIVMSALIYINNKLILVEIIGQMIYFCFK